MSLQSQNAFSQQAITHNKNAIKSKQKDHGFSNQTSYDKKFHNIKVSDILSHAQKVQNTKKNVEVNLQKPMNNQMQKNQANKRTHNNDNNIKHKNKLIQYASLKRPQTPDPVSSAGAGQQTVKYPKPEVILKQIERNVNVLKQMYFASLSQHRSTSQKQSSGFQNNETIYLSKSQQNKPCDISEEVLQSQRRYKNQIKASNNNAFNKKSIPQISIASNYNPHNKNVRKVKKNLLFQQLKDSYQKQEEQFSSMKRKQKNSKQKAKDLKNNQEMSKQKEKTEKDLTEKRKSVSSLQRVMDKKQTNTKQKTVNQKIYQKEDNLQHSTTQNSQKNSTNINSLFEIFKFYKRSIDSSLSRQSSKINIASNNSTTQKAQSKEPNVYISHENHNSLNDKSYGKYTPNNSTTKNTTNHKNSTNSRIGGSSIQPSIDVSIEEDPFKNQKVSKNKKNKKSRNNSKSNSAKKIKQNHVVVNNKNLAQSKPKYKKNDEKLRKTANSVNHKEGGKEAPKNYAEQINSKIMKIHKKQLKLSHVGQIGKEEKNLKRKSKQKETYDNKTFKKKANQKKQEKKGAEQPKIQKPINKRNQNNEDQNQYIGNLQFPQIQSSAFNRNMPILEQDSQQEASSSLIAVNTQRDDNACYLQEVNEQKLNVVEFNKQKNLEFGKKEYCQKIELHTEQDNQSLKIIKQQFVLSHSNQKVFIKIQQNTRFPTPSFVASDVEDIQKYSRANNQETQKQLINRRDHHQNKIQLLADDSLVGCQIPKENNSSDLQNFELVSFQL